MDTLDYIEISSKNIDDCITEACEHFSVTSDRLEYEVIQQGSAVVIYMLPNMFVVMGLIVLVVFLGTRMDHALLTLILILITAILAGLSYMRVMSLARK